MFYNIKFIYYLYYNYFIKNNKTKNHDLESFSETQNLKVVHG